MSCREMCHCLSPGKKIFFIPVLTQAYVSTVGGNKKAIEKYIREQEAEDQICDPLSFKEYEDPFKDAKDFDDDSPDIPNEDLEKK